MSDIQERADRGELGDELIIDDIIELWWPNVEERPDNRPERCEREGARDLLKGQMVEDIKSGGLAARRSAVRLNEHTTRTGLDTAFAPKEWLERGFGRGSENKPSPQPEYIYAIGRAAFVRWFKKRDYSLPDDTSLTKWLPELVEWIPDSNGPGVIISTARLPPGRGPKSNREIHSNANMGRLDEHLFIEEIAELWFPTLPHRYGDKHLLRLNRDCQRKATEEIREAIKADKLEAVAYPKPYISTGHFIPDCAPGPERKVIEISYLIHRDAFRTWLDSRRGRLPPDDCPLWSWWEHEQDESPPEPRGNDDTNKNNTSRLDKRISLILQAIDSKGYDRMNIPRTGKREVKELCLETHKTLFTESTFEEAWKKASGDSLLSIENKAAYTKGRK